MHEHHEMQGVELKLSQSHKIDHHLLFLLCKTLQSTQVGYLAWGQLRTQMGCFGMFGMGSTQVGWEESLLVGVRVRGGRRAESECLSSQ